MLHAADALVPAGEGGWPEPVPLGAARVADQHTPYYAAAMAIRESIIPVRVTKDDRTRLRRAAGEEPVSSWLRRLGLAEAKRREAAAGVARHLDALAKGGPGMSDVEAAELAAEAIRETRSRKR
jgi:hypothetical protein